MHRMKVNLIIYSMTSFIWSAMSEILQHSAQATVENPSPFMCCIDPLSLHSSGETPRVVGISVVFVSSNLSNEHYHHVHTCPLVTVIGLKIVEVTLIGDFLWVLDELLQSTRNNMASVCRRRVGNFDTWVLRLPIDPQVRLLHYIIKIIAISIYS